MIANLQQIVTMVESGWRRAPILVVGDVMLDKYVWGEVERISPEAPVPVVHVTFREHRPGGAGNVAMNLAGLGARVTVCGFAGADLDQKQLEDLLADAGVEPLLTGVRSAPTTTKLRVLSGNQQVVRLDEEVLPSSYPVSAQEHLLEGALAELSNAAVLVLSDYAKGVLTERVCRVLISQARSHGVPVLIDPKLRNFARYRGGTAICPNRKELSKATGAPLEDLNRLLGAGQAMLQSLRLKFMAVTLGEKGIALLLPESRLHIPAIARQVCDVSGAGDTVIAVLALAMACGIDVDDAAQVANLAAGIVVSKAGTVPIQRDELLGAISQEIALHPGEKIMPLDRLLQRVASWRAAGQRVAFTNGCFDILHVGHVTLLEQARRTGDRLIVGLNNDGSVRQLKGLPRPLVAEGDRARILAALRAVDAVVLFDESTPLKLIEAIRPDVLVKGGDYCAEDIVGAGEVCSWGGQVVVIPLVEGISTSGLIKKSAARTLVAASRSAEVEAAG